MRIIFFTKYTRLGASSRVRTFLYLPAIKERSVECHVSAFFTDKYLDEVYLSKKHNKWQALRGFVRRVCMLMVVSRYDRVVIEKELIPYFPAIFERLLNLFGIRYIVDYDDAIFHNYDVSTSPIIRSLLGRKIDTVMRLSGTVLSGNSYISERALKSGAKHIVCIPTVIDTSKYVVKEYRKTDKFVIGWIGSPITHKYLAALAPVFRRLAENYDIQVTLVGASKGIGLPAYERLVPWSEQTEVLEIQNFNVGIMPLEDNIWERGKCGYKLIQYMGCGLPVVGTPIGVNDQIIVHGVNGYKANSLSEWYDALQMIIEGGVEKERKFGTAGRGLVEREYSLASLQPRYLKALLN